MESVVTFQIENSWFGVPSSLVKWIVDIEEVFSVSMMPEFVIGEIEQNGNLYFLVCLNKLLGFGECKDVVGKNAIIMAIGNREFAIVVDEIHKIEELKEVRSDDVVEFVRDGDEVVEVLKESFFAKLNHIPTMKPAVLMEESDTKKKMAQELSFLLFYLGDQVFGLEADSVQFVEVIEDAKKGAFIPNEPFIEGVYVVKNRLMYVINLAKYLKVADSVIENILVLKKDNAYIGIGVGEILNIASVPKDAINYSQADEKSCCFLQMDRVVTVLSHEHLMHLMDRFGIVSTHKDTQKRIKTSTREFVIACIGAEYVAIDVEEIKALHEIKDVHITKALEHRKGIDGIVAIGTQSYLLFDLNSLAQRQCQEESGLILVMRSSYKGEEFAYALKIADVQQIVQVDEKDVYEVISQDLHFIKGSLHLSKEIYNILNTAWVVAKLKGSDE